MQARCALRRFRSYRGRVDSFGPFAVGLLDKFEGVLGGDLLDPRRYADHLGMHCLLGSCGLQALVVDGSGVTMEACERLSRVQPGGATWAEAVPELRGGALDMVFARYDTPGWQHYRSVRFLDGGAWRVSDEARGRVAARLAACDVCQALLVGDVDLARGCMVSIAGAVRWCCSVCRRRELRVGVVLCAGWVRHPLFKHLGRLLGRAFRGRFSFGRWCRRGCAGLARLQVCMFVL